MEEVVNLAVKKDFYVFEAKGVAEDLILSYAQDYAYEHPGCKLPIGVKSAKLIVELEYYK